MCGILAILGIPTGADSMRHTALKLSKLLRHRGPDWSGIYCEGNNILCHERLAIVGVDDGSQPLTNKSKTIFLTVNGEIYNYRLLQSSLKKPHTFLTHSDCEVLLHAYAEYGIDFLKELKVNGMFAFVLYDSETDTYFAARDHMGIIPLYYGHGRDGSVWFASEMKALQDHCETFDVFPPGHYFSSKTQSFERFWTPIWLDPSIIPTKRIDPAELRDAFEQSVIRHMMSDVPMGVLLSGGLDSSLVAAIAQRHSQFRTEDYADFDADKQHHLREKHVAMWPRMHSFCIGLKGSPDAIAAEKVAQMIGTVHHSYTFTIQEGLDVLSDVIYHLETYDVTTIRASTPMFLMSRKIKATGVKMVISGEGSDEIFGGYLYFHKAPNKEEFHKENIRKLEGLHRYDCLRANKSTLAWGLEARVPFLDREFMDVAMTFDPEQKMCVDVNGKKRMEKSILRTAFDLSVEMPSSKKKKTSTDSSEKEEEKELFLPHEILWRQKEQFSDGVGYGWIDSLKAHAEQNVTDTQLAQAKFRFPYNTPGTKEAYYYRMIFSQHFPSDAAAKTVPGGPSVACSTAAAIEWDASFKNRADPSGRAVTGVHTDAYSAEIELKSGL